MEKRNTFSILFYLKKDKIDKTNQAPIYMKITINGVKAECATQRRIEVTQWRANGNMPNTSKFRAINDHLTTMRSKIMEAHTELIKLGITPTPKVLIEMLNGRQAIQSNKTIKQAIQAQYERVYNLIGTSFSKATATRYNTIVGHMDDFIPTTYKKQDINLSELDYHFAEKYTTYLRTVRRCNHNSAMKYMKMLKAVIHYAQKCKWINQDPFREFECPIEKTETIFLTKTELHKMETKELSIERIRIIRDIFVFACYTGLSYIDISSLTPSSVIQHNGHWLIKSNRHKTNEPYIAYLLPNCIKIIERYREHPITSIKDTLFPVPSNQKTNVYLKELADLCQIDKHLTFHVARRTFATTVCLGNGIATEVIQKVLGHANIKTTQIYAQTTEELIINQFSKLQNQ